MGEGVSRPTPRGKLKGLAWGVSRPTPGGCIPACSEAHPPPWTATAAGGTHPTGMHSCYFSLFHYHVTGNLHLPIRGQSRILHTILLNFPQKNNCMKLRKVEKIEYILRTFWAVGSPAGVRPLNPPLPILYFIPHASQVNSSSLFHSTKL